MLDEKNDPTTSDDTNAVEKKEEVTSKTEELTTDTKETQAEDTTVEEVQAETQEAVNELEETVAEDSEDESATKRHEIPVLDYHSMSMENLVKEFGKLVKNEKIQVIKDHVDQIKTEFNQKYGELIEQKKEEFIADGGNIIDFRYTTVVKTDFNSIYNEYKEKRNAYYKNLEQDLKQNLANRLTIIEELKGLINVEENINTTYKHFKSLQEQWRNAGPIPRGEYNNVWRTYHHHIERFYDFLHLNRDLRDLDFKRNLEEKEQIIAQAEALAEEADANKAFRKLQSLHKIWKEEVGPVAKELREDIWQRFSNATKVIHDKRQEYLKNIDAIYEQNLIKKQEIISNIMQVANEKVSSHNVWQKKIKEIEALREAFFNAGKVPLKVNEDTWAAFKEAVRTFNRNKNAFYKDLKKDQQSNLNKKLDLVKTAQAHKDSEDWEMTTPIMKKIQSEWKRIGHVPRKHSDRIWKEFKDACNHYFDRLHASKNKASEQEIANLETKNVFLEKMNALEFSGDKEADLEVVKQHIDEWKGIGRVPYNKKNIEDTFNKRLDGIFKKLGVDPTEAEMIKYSNKMSALSESKDHRKIENERNFVRKKITEITGKMHQLENNLQFFANSNSENPLVKDVHKNIEKHRKELDIWKAKLKHLKEI
ncbi:DUF349 domain-containing protein [Spongiivirga sp. MCCC 1A20706]|uniref:DUF349 domain-containing protein n=1 Tax=Spongiivirga sp. MCCC 1A20706 TaxID=3160963 RepID=UPI0039774307